MTYLATEMLLYLASAAVIGLALGWLFWGAGQRRRLGALRSDLMAKIEAGREAHNKTKLALEQAEIDAKKTIEALKAEQQRSLESERLAAKQAETELERVRSGVDEAIHEARTSSQDALEQAMQVAHTEKAIAAEAVAKESRSRAQIEELRLLIGAEKLAAESARAELETLRSEMLAQLEAERAAHGQAKVALDDIRSTLAKTFGPEVLDIAARQGAVDAPPAFAHVTDERGLMSPSDHDQTGFAVMTEIAAAGDALNNPDLDEADIEDREDLSLDLPTTIDEEPDREAEEDTEEEALPEDGKIDFRPLPELKRPSTFLDELPDSIDNLQAIDGIGPELERRLYDNGCYHYRQIADLTTEDIDWLAQALDTSSQQIDDERWIEQAKALDTGAEVNEDSSSMDAADQRNVAG